jgi:hypothetical protein
VGGSPCRRILSRLRIRHDRPSTLLHQLEARLGAYRLARDGDHAVVVFFRGAAPAARAGGATGAAASVGTGPVTAACAFTHVAHVAVSGLEDEHAIRCNAHAIDSRLAKLVDILKPPGAR